mmetsp:Transcript_57745/g.125589  ORF Transcript_57745/g.125589 Transcript_57745/m.125589 type:complete len:150 (-) Transcript_57745:53-502(-)
MMLALRRVSPFLGPRFAVAATRASACRCLSAVAPSWPLEPETGRDPIRGFRIAEEYDPAKDKRRPLAAEYESIYEEDQLSGEGQGPSDTIFGEWGVDREVPWFGDYKALFMWLCGFGFFATMGTLARGWNAPARNPAAPREVTPTKIKE